MLYRSSDTLLDRLSNTLLARLSNRSSNVNFYKNIVKEYNNCNKELFSKCYEGVRYKTGLYFIVGFNEIGYIDSKKCDYDINCILSYTQEDINRLNKNLLKYNLLLKKFSTSLRKVSIMLYKFYDLDYREDSLKVFKNYIANSKLGLMKLEEDKIVDRYVYYASKKKYRYNIKRSKFTNVIFIFNNLDD